jgi:hypothetical protein
MSWLRRMSAAEKLQWWSLAGAPLDDAVAAWDRELALAAATGTAKTPQAVECEASQSGPKGSAQPSEPKGGDL